MHGQQATILHLLPQLVKLFLSNLFELIVPFISCMCQTHKTVIAAASTDAMAVGPNLVRLVEDLNIGRARMLLCAMLTFPWYHGE